MQRAFKIGAVLVLSIVILGAVILVVGFEATIEAVARAGLPAFAAVGLLIAIHLGLQASAWKSLNRGIHHRVRFRTLFAAVTAGMAVNILTPSSYLGGEPIKVLYVGRRTGLPYHEVAGTVVLSKYLEILSFLGVYGFATTVATITFRETLFRGPYLSLGVALLALTAALLILCLALWIGLHRAWQPLAGVVRLVWRLWPRSRLLARVHDRARRMEEQAARIYRDESVTTAKAFAKLFVSHVAVFLKPAAFLGLGSWSGLGLGELSLIFVASQTLTGLQFTPSGVGLLDGGLIGTFVLLGRSEPTCMAFLLCIRFWDLVTVAGGAFLGARAGARLLSSRTEAPAAPVEMPAVEPAVERARV
ncbi:MAG: flippase-like domain-containing protein [Planctomycetes bacterium]|nr:flippase-like domain-containing protein [Planctomycetota bacterium]